MVFSVLFTWDQFNKLKLLLFCVARKPAAALSTVQENGIASRQVINAMDFSCI